ncbi:MAG: hypothetical protein ACFE0I_07445 [Elainellaceae cyanobacterium]
MLVLIGAERWTTTSLRQGRSREGGSVGEACRRLRKPAAKVRADVRVSVAKQYRNVIEGRVPGASWHNTTKPYGSGDTVNDAVAHRQFTVLSGEVCPYGIHQG